MTVTPPATTHFLGRDVMARAALRIAERLTVASVVTVTAPDAPAVAWVALPSATAARPASDAFANHPVPYRRVRGVLELGEERSRVGRALRRFGGQGTLHQRVDRVAGAVDCRHVSTLLCGEHRPRVLAREQPRTGEQLVEDDAHGVDIRAGIGRPAAENFRRYIPRGSRHRRFDADRPRETEVHQLRDTVAIHQDVCRLHVAVYDPGRMCMSQTGEGAA